MATLYQRDGWYYLNYTINGHRVRRSVGKDRKKAEIFLGELQYKLSNGDVKPKRAEIPVDLFFDRYLANCDVRLAKGTVIRYTNAIKHLRQFFTIHHPIKFISQMGKGAIQEYTIYRQKSKRKLKSKTINMELAVLRTAMMWALDNDWIEKNPASRIKMLKTNDSKRGQIITEEEIGRLIEGCNQIKDGQWFKDILIVFLNTGMRSGELLNLTWPDVDLVDQNVIKIQEKPFWKPKTYERNLPINETAKNVLVGLQMRSKGIFVFTREGKKIDQNVPRKMLIKVAKKVGLNHITRIHDLRHTFCSKLLMQGVDIPTVSALLGHKSWSTTALYSHQTKEHTRNAVKKLG